MSDQPHQPHPPHQPVLRPRMEVLSGPTAKTDTRGLLHAQQRGSSIIPYKGATVRVVPDRGVSHKFYRGTITSTILDTPKKQRNRKHHRKNREHRRQEHLGGYSQDAPATATAMAPSPRPKGRGAKACARCPSDRAVLAKKGATSVIMETPPLIPCHPWSSVEKVKQEIVAGPEPGTKLSEGSHKLVIRLYHRRRTIDTCVTRYNVIVRQCGELEVGLGVHKHCPLGNAWGATCNVTCDPGYELEGNSVLDCTDDLEWSGNMPHCLPTAACPVPVSPENGHLSCRTPQHRPIRPRGMLPDGSVCHYQCDAGYTVPPAQHRLTRVRCIGGAWDSDQDPVCVETNELEEEEPPLDITADDALRFDGKDCPKDFCANGGKCIMILEDPMCSCKPGFSGPNCEDENSDTDPEESNTID